MHKYICFAATILIVAVIAFGCSSGSSPTAPVLRDNLAPRDSSGIGQTGLVGLWQVAVDLNSQTIEAVPARTSDLMLNVLGFMEPPVLDKMTIDWVTLVINFEESTIDVDVIFIHPLVTPENAFQGFDVRGIVFGPICLNPDGYTAVMNPADFETVPFGYLDGMLGAPHSYANYDADYWPYKYFCDDLDDATMELWDFYYNHPDIAAHRGKFGEGETHKRHYSLSWAGLEPPMNFLVFNYAVYANFDWAVGDTPHTNDDYPITTANSAEAFCMSYDVVDNNLNFYEDEGWGEISMDIRIWDWQGLDSTEVTIESVETGVIAAVTEGTFGPGSDPFDGVVSFVDAPGEPTSLADLDILITVTDNSTTYGDAWFFGLLPTDHAYYDLPVENYWIITVPVGEESPCATVEPVDIEAPPYNGIWFDDCDEDTACACEVDNVGETTMTWVHDQASTSWNFGESVTMYDNDMDIRIIGPKVLVPSTGAMEWDFHFDSDNDGLDGERFELGYIINDGTYNGLGGTSASVTDSILSFKIAGLTPADELSWVVRWISDDVDNAGSGAILWDVTSTVFDPGPMPVISDGGTPDPDNAICSDPNATILTSWFCSGQYTYRYLIDPDFRFGASSTLVSWTWGNSGWMCPYYGPDVYVAIDTDEHVACDPTDTWEGLYAFRDYAISSSAQADCGSAHPDWGTDPAGEVRYMIKDDGTATERLIIEWCDIGQIGEGDTCHYRAVLNGGDNTNPYDIRLEYIDIGTQTVDEDAGAYMIWNAVYLPIQCDPTAWTNNMAIDIDQPDVY